MSRTRIELDSKDNEQLSPIIENILNSHGYNYTLYKNTDEKVWSQGIGLVKAPKYIKYYFENNKLILEGWIGNYGKESELKGVVASLPKRDVKKVLNEIENSVNQFNQNNSNENISTKTENKTVDNKTTSSNKTQNNDTPNKTNSVQNNPIQPQLSNKNIRNRIIYDVISIVISLIILSGALMGSLVLRGTNSSGALALFILLFLIYEVYSLIKHIKEKNAIDNQNSTNISDKAIPNINQNQQNIKTENITPNKTETTPPTKREIKNNTESSVANIPPLKNTQPTGNTQNIPQTNQTTNTTNNNFSSRIKNMDEKKKKICAAIIVVVILGICFGAYVASFSEDTYYYDDGDYSYDLTMSISDVTETKDSAGYSYEVNGQVTGTDNIPVNSYLNISYFDSSGDLIDYYKDYNIDYDTYGTFHIDFNSDTKVDMVSVELIDSDDYFLTSDIYFV